MTTYAEQDEAKCGVPALSPVAGEPLQPGERTRLAVMWDGPCFEEFEPATGEVVSSGRVEELASPEGDAQRRLSGVFPAHGEGPGSRSLSCSPGDAKGGVAA